MVSRGWDGEGYPDGLRGEAIPIAARIVAVADAYDALVSDRVYRQGFDREKARGILRAGSGSQWDARVVHALLAVQGSLGALPAEVVDPPRQGIGGMADHPASFDDAPGCREALDRRPKNHD